MTTRRFPRSLSEAFPQDRAYAVEVYRRPVMAEVSVGLAWVLMLLLVLFGFHLIARYWDVLAGLVA